MRTLFSDCLDVDYWIVVTKLLMENMSSLYNIIMPNRFLVFTGISGSSLISHSIVM